MQDPQAQAMVEMLVALPALLLLAAAAVQFSILFLAKVQFEHACGEAARKYSAGLLTESSLPSGIWNSLGQTQSAVLQGSIHLSQVPKDVSFFEKTGLPSGSKGILRSIGETIRIPMTTLLDYGGGTWTAEALLKPPPFFRLLFANGVPIRTQFAILRHPSRSFP